MKTIAEKMAQFATGEIDDITIDEYSQINNLINQFWTRIYVLNLTKDEEKKKRNIEKLSNELKKLKDNNMLIDLKDFKEEHFYLLNGRCCMSDYVASEILGYSLNSYRYRRTKVGVKSLNNDSLINPIRDDEINDIILIFKKH